MTAPFFDVRNKGFGPRTPVADVFKLLDARVASLPAEAVSLGEAAGRVLAGSVTAAVNIPGFARAAMDGFAVRAADARIDNPLSLVGESLPGRPFAGTVATGQAVRIMTGAPLPNGADAVLRVEAAEEAEGRVRAQAAIAPGRDLGRIGEDVLAGSEVLAAGRRLRPQDVGMLAALGIGTIAAIRRPRVAILATGDELLPPGSKPEGCRIVDSNSPMLAALIHRDGGVPLPVRYVLDRLEAVRAALVGADADAIVVSGGSSVGKEDHAPRSLAELGELAVHGIAIRPAGPTGIGFLQCGMPVFLLPGNPVACLCGYDLFAGRAIRRMGGRDSDVPYRKDAAPLRTAIGSAKGRLDYVRVRLIDGEVEPIPGRGGSLLSTAVAADGFILVDAERESLPSGELVDVWLFDG